MSEHYRINMEGPHGMWRVQDITLIRSKGTIFDDQLADFRILKTSYEMHQKAQDIHIPISAAIRGCLPKQNAKPHIRVRWLGNHLTWNSLNGDALIDVVLAAGSGDWKMIWSNKHKAYKWTLNGRLSEGSIDLDSLKFNGNDAALDAMLLGGDKVGRASQLALVPSGLSFQAQVRFPWFDPKDKKKAFSGRWLLTRCDNEGAQTSWRIMPDLAAMAEQDSSGPNQGIPALLKVLRTLVQALQPPVTLNGGRPDWVSLELAAALSQQTLPEFYWEYDSDARKWQFHLGHGAIKLRLESEGVAGDAESLVAVEATITHDGHGIVVRFFSDADATPSKHPSTLQYHADRKGTDWHENMVVTDVDMTMDTLAHAEWLRSRQGRTNVLPTREAGTFKACSLWGCIPVGEGGWAQLPFLNVTDEVYIVAGYGKKDKASDGEPEVQPSQGLEFSGVALYGNGLRDYLYDAGNGSMTHERPWSVAVLGGNDVEGKLVLDSSLQQVSLCMKIVQPELQMTGALECANDAPDARDALPDPGNWPAYFQDFPLRSSREGEEGLWPSPYRFKVEGLRFHKRTLDDSGVDRSRERREAELESWSVAWRTTDVYERLGTFLDQDDGVKLVPLIWRRHPSLPLVQSLPMTQSLEPAVSPCASRELIPYELPSFEFTLGAEGAGSWQDIRFPETIEPSRDWRNGGRETVASGPAGDLLEMAALTLPGLSGIARTSKMINGQGTPGWIYRHDLPILDEVNALTVTPENEEPPDSVLVPNEPPRPSTQFPLTRDVLAEHWARLVEKAFMARADAVAGVEPESESTLENIVEPYVWSDVEAVLTQDYPGTLSFEDQETGEKLELLADPDPGKFTALRGIQGGFDLDDASQLRFQGENATGSDFRLTGGSMHITHEKGRFRDQRGLLRAGTKRNTNLLVTPLELDVNPLASQRRVLCTLRKAVLTPVGAQNGYAFWCRDLPMRKVGNSHYVFDRAYTQDDDADALDTNNPEASSRLYAWKSGYEWRWGTPLEEQASENNAENEPHLLLWGLEVYPLRLEKLVVSQTEEIKEIEIAARLQLPVEPPHLEDIQHANEVLLCFASFPGSTQLNVHHVTLRKGAELVWPLTRPPAASREPQPSPRLRIRKLSVSDSVLQVVEGELEFHLLGARCHLELPETELSFPVSDPSGVSVTWKQDDPTEEDRVSSVTLTVFGPPRSPQKDETIKSPFPHNIMADVVGRWGGAGQLGFEARITWDLLNRTALMSEGNIVHGGQEWLVEIDDQENTGVHEKSIRVQWGLDAKDLEPKILPGIPLEHAQGMAVLWFDVEAPDKGTFPRLVRRGGWMEAICSCSWGISRSDAIAEKPEGVEKRDWVFGTGSGRLYVDYTLEWKVPEQEAAFVWQPNCLVNGSMEVNNVFSWPASISSVDDDASETVTVTVTLPASTGGDSFAHNRHTLGILFQQHRIPSSLLWAGEESMIHFGEGAWSFLAVTHHTVTRVELSDDGSTVTGLTKRASWSGVQEVRLSSRDACLNLFKQVSDVRIPQLRRVRDPRRRLSDVGSAWQSNAMLSLLRDTAGVAGLSSEGSLLVEASTQMWLNTSPEHEVLKQARVQTLPDGVLVASSAAPGDFTGMEHASNPEGEWNFVALPFLGRTAAAVSSAQADAAVHPIVQDPLWVVIQASTSGGTLSKALELALHFCCRGWEDIEKNELMPFDLRTVPRLGQHSLRRALTQAGLWAENTTPFPDQEGGADGETVRHMHPMMWGLRDLASAREATEEELRKSFGLHEEPFEGDKIKWHPDALQAFHVAFVERSERGSFAPCAKQLEVALTKRSKETGPSQKVVATLLHVPDRKHVGVEGLATLAVSPYRSFEFDGVDSSKLKKVLASTVEVWAAPPLEKNWSSRGLTYVGGKVWRAKDEQDVAPDWSLWAREFVAATAPACPFAVLRERVVKTEERAPTGGNEEAERPQIVIHYNFYSVDLQQNSVQVPKPGRPLRSALAALTFREAQFGGFTLPVASTWNDEDEEQDHLRDVEIAPPLVNGVQPVWEAGKATNEYSSDHGHLSALRLAFQFMQPGGEQSGSAMVGGLASNAVPQTVWWAGLQQRVQWRPSDETWRELPPAFKARAVEHYLPSPLNAPLPPLYVLDAADDTDSTKPVDWMRQWQALLLEGQHALSIGLRPGVPMLHLPQLITQTVKGSTHGKRPIPTLSQHQSGTVSVQHRTPRPVPFPENEGDPATDWLTWAASFDPGCLCRVGASPQDTAVWINGDETSHDMGHGIRIEVAAMAPKFALEGERSEPFLLPHGIVPVEGEGRFRLQIKRWVLKQGSAWEIHMSEPMGKKQEYWRILGVPPEGEAAWISDGVRILPLVIEVQENEQNLPSQALDQEVLSLIPGPGEDWNEWVGALLHGTRVQLQMGVARCSREWDENKKTWKQEEVQYEQGLQFPMYICRQGAELPPQRPYHVNFEDPEYNRRIGSVPMKREGHILQGKQKIGAVAATDRQEYNADSELIFALEYKESPKPSMYLHLVRIDQDGVHTPLLEKNREIVTERIVRISLGTLELVPGDVLSLSVVAEEQDDKDKAQLGITVPIVREPVLPAPESAYALLRRSSSSGETPSVSCARFAWGPAATRIDLLDTKDLFKNFVRRRATFAWVSHEAFNPEAAFSIQKIAATGSTHVPPLAMFSNASEEKT